jgi:hypothetical protein
VESTWQPLSDFFECSTSPTSTPSLQAPGCLTVEWKAGDSQKVLNRTSVPQQIGLVDLNDQPLEMAFSYLTDEFQNTDVGEMIAIGQPVVELGTTLFQAVYVRIEDSGGSSLSLQPFRVIDSLRVPLIRTRWCSRIRNDLHDKIKARRIENLPTGAIGRHISKVILWYAYNHVQFQKTPRDLFMPFPMHSM